VTIDSPALSIRGLVKYYRHGLLGRRASLPAIDDVDLRVERGEVLGLIGESGSGKTSLARAALRLLEVDRGEIRVLGQDLRSLTRGQLRRFRKRAQMLFQSPSAHLNPGLDVRAILAESARLHRPRETTADVVDRVLDQVGLLHRGRARASELSGGEQRRVGLATILIADPELVVADEPTSGLDAMLKGELIDLLLLGRSPERGYLIVSHDIPLVAYASDRIAVMFAGRILEEFPVEALASPHHPYTAALLAAADLVDLGADPGLPVGRGAVGCPYVGACPRAMPVCAAERPGWTELGTAHRVACHAIAQEGR
jgi:ABC-type glutathione transport system ATPase component